MIRDVEHVSFFFSAQNLLHMKTLGFWSLQLPLGQTALSRKTTLQISDLGELSEKQTAKHSLSRFMRYYAQEKSNKDVEDVSLGKVFWRTTRTKFLLGLIFLIAYLSLEFLKAVSFTSNLISCQMNAVQVLFLIANNANILLQFVEFFC